MRNPDELPVNIYQSDERITVSAPMPGLEPEDVSVEVTRNGELVLDGALRGSFKGVNDVLVNEWTAGGYHRQVRLPAPVDGSMANVTYGNGVLVVALPLSSAIHPARLTLRSVGPTQGEHIGNTGHPVRPLNDEEHHSTHNK